MADRNDWVVTLRGIVEQMVAADVTDLELRRGDLRIRLRREPRITADPPAPATTGDASGRDGVDLHRVAAPLTGIYYAAPNPASRPYVALGDWVDHDTVVGLIETMKVFNEVTADCRGRVAAIQVQQGQLIHAGEALLLVDVAAAPDHAGEVGS